MGGVGDFCRSLQIFTDDWKARSRLDRRRFLQSNTHFAAFFEVYKTICLNFQNFVKFCKKSARSRGEILLKIRGRGAEVCQSCRPRKMLQNEYLVVKIGFDTAEI